MDLECARRKGKTFGWIGSLLVQDELTVSWADQLLTEQADLLLYSCLFKFLSLTTGPSMSVACHTKQASLHVSNRSLSRVK